MNQRIAHTVAVLRRHPSLAPSLVCLLAIVASLSFSLGVFPLISAPWSAALDPDRYGELARNVYEGHGLSYGERETPVPALDRGPAYPFLLAALFALGRGEPVALVQVTQAVMHGATGMLVFFLGIRLFSRRAALAAQAVHALHPILIWYTARIWAETFHTLIVVAVGYALLLLLERATFRRIALLGALLALSLLTKAILLLLPLPLLAYSVARGSRATTLGLASAAVMAVLLVLPWSLRNYRVAGEVVPVHISLGQNLLQGEVLGEHGLALSHRELWLRGDELGDSILANTGLTMRTPRGDEFLTSTVLARWMQEPLRFVRHVAVNAVTFWYLGESPPKSLIAIILQLPLLLLLARALPAVRQRPAIIPLLIVVAYIWALHAVVFGWLRFSVPVLPLVILIGVGGLVAGRALEEPARRGGARA